MSKFDLNLYEVMDRVSVMIAQIDDSIRSHQSIIEHPELEVLIDACSDSLMSLYQTTSSILFKSGKDPRQFGKTE